MTLIYIAQLLLPVALVLWMAIAPPRSRLGWGVQLAATLLVLWAMAHIGIWLFPPWWTPHAASALVVATALWAWLRGAPPTAWPKGIASWSAALLFGGYLRTPMPADASPAAQADAHVCLLDALGVRQAGVLGASAGAPSAMQMAIRHPDRVSALVLVVPIAYKPSTLADSASPLSPLAEKMLMRLIGSDFLFWAGLHVARDQVIKYVLATPPEQVASASHKERARVKAMLDNILPVSTRAQGLHDDSALGRNMVPYPLESIRAPTLVISTRDDGFGTYASAQYTASRIAGAKFVGFDEGGHTFVGHDDEIRAEIVKLLIPPASP